MNKEFQNLKKAKLRVTEYNIAFIEKMKLFPYLVPTKLSKIEIFSHELPTYFGPMVKMATTLKEAVRAVKNVETQIRKNFLEKVEVGEKRKFEGSSRPNK